MYFPKNKIKTGLNSNGDLVYKDSKIPYYGIYFETYSGKYYAGETPNYANLVELILSDDLQSEKNQKENPNQDLYTQDLRFGSVSKSTYSKQINTPQDSPIQLPPTYSTTSPTPQDIVNGSYVKYFAKKTNEFIYIEISSNTFNKLRSQDPTILWQLYDSLSMIYSTTSTIANTKSATLIEKNNQWLGFVDYLKLN